MVPFPHAAPERIHLKTQPHLLFYPHDRPWHRPEPSRASAHLCERTGEKTSVMFNMTFNLLFITASMLFLFQTYLQSIYVKYLNQDVYGNKYQNKQFPKHRNQCERNFCKQTYHVASSHYNIWKKPLFQALLNFLIFIKYPPSSLLPSPVLKNSVC